MGTWTGVPQFREIFDHVLGVKLLAGHLVAGPTSFASNRSAALINAVALITVATQAWCSMVRRSEARTCLWLHGGTSMVSVIW